MKKSKRVKKAKKEIELIAKKYGFEVTLMDVTERSDSYTIRPYLTMNKKATSS